MAHWQRITAAAGVILACVCGCPDGSLPPIEFPWPRHVIDDASRGADGVRLADVNGDGRLDIATGWEEGGRIRVCLNPGPGSAKLPWPAVTVGEVGSPEDAVFADLDGDGAVDVVSSSEGSVRTMHVHWAPAQDDYLDASKWQTEALMPSQGLTLWMFCLPLQVDGRYGIDLIAGAKGGEARIGWFESPQDARNLGAWTWHSICEAGWIMSLVAEDMDGDGDPDILASDRKGESRGCLWLENPGPGPLQAAAWPRHDIGGADHEVMFLTSADLDGDGRRDIVAATAARQILYFARRAGSPPAWDDYTIPIPSTAGTGKGVAVGDVNLDGRNDIVFTCEHAEDRPGVMWLSYTASPTAPLWQSHDISGPTGVKYDRVELIDLDTDGDLDVLTCEERTNLGVIWYENPTIR